VLSLSRARAKPVSPGQGVGEAGEAEAIGGLEDALGVDEEEEVAGVAAGLGVELVEAEAGGQVVVGDHRAGGGREGLGGDHALELGDDHGVGAGVKGGAAGVVGGEGCGRGGGAAGQAQHGPVAVVEGVAAAVHGVTADADGEEVGAVGFDGEPHGLGFRIEAGAGGVTGGGAEVDVGPDTSARGQRDDVGGRGLDRLGPPAVGGGVECGRGGSKDRDQAFRRQAVGKTPQGRSIPGGETARGEDQSPCPL
jgi:hypothetical protein